MKPIQIHFKENVSKWGQRRNREGLIRTLSMSPRCLGILEQWLPKQISSEVALTSQYESEFLCVCVRVHTVGIKILCKDWSIFDKDIKTTAHTWCRLCQMDMFQDKICEFFWVKADSDALICFQSALASDHLPWQTDLVRLSGKLKELTKWNCYSVLPGNSVWWPASKMAWMVSISWYSPSPWSHIMHFTRASLCNL